MMMPTPNVYLDQSRDYHADLAPELKSTEVRLIYVTYRVPEQDEDGSLAYGYGRSASMGFGTVVVDFGKDIGWEQHVEASRVQQRLERVWLVLVEVEEIVRGPRVP